MATNNQLLLTQTFTSQDSITITHNLNRLNLDYRVIVDSVSRPDLVRDVVFSSGNERNEFSIRLTSSNTGVIQVLDTDRYPTNLPTPENSFKLVHEQGTKDLLKDAVALYKTPNPAARQDSVEKIWDAFECIVAEHNHKGRYGLFHFTRAS